MPSATDAAIARLPENVRTARVAEAMFSPSATLLAGGGAAAGILIGGFPVGLVLAPVLGVGLWAARVAMAVRRKGSKRVSLSKLTEPWRSMVADALQAQARFDDVVRKVPAGPLRDELAAVGVRVADGVRECESIARKGVQLDQARQQLGTSGATGELERLRGERSLRAQSGADLSSLDAAISAVQRQVEAGARVERVAFDARDRLRLLNAQLDEAVAAAIEVTVRPGAGTAGLSGRVDTIVDQLENLAQALDEAEAASSGLPAPTATLPRSNQI